MNGPDYRVWGLVDGSLSVSGSMLLAALINHCHGCAGIQVIGPLLSLLKEISDQNAGVIVLGTLLLFPTTLICYGGLKMWFAAKEAVERKAMEKGRQEGRQEERQRISQALEREGISVTPELARILGREPEPRS